MSDDPDAALEAIFASAGRLSASPPPTEAGKDELRRLKGALHLLLALCDLGGVLALETVTMALSRFADLALDAALSMIAAEGRAAPGDKAGAGPIPGFVCLALGKHGGFELNYSSDIDVSLFYDPAALSGAGEDPSRRAARIAQRLVDVLQSRTAEGYVFRVDLRLRPDPASTPAALPIEAALDYYETVGQNWERAALIKARPAAGDLALGAEFLASLTPFVWRRALDYEALADIGAIKRQIHVHKVDERLSAPGADVKLGAGGIREIEFFAQTQQLIFGGRDPALRAPSTLGALAALAAAGRVAPEAAAELASAYRALRDLEHRIQMVNDEQTHVLPESRTERRRVAQLSGYGDLNAFDASVSRILRRVNARYAELFPGEEPLSSRFGSLVFTGVEDDPETLRTLERMGFANPAQIARTIRAWHHGRIGATRSERGRELFTRLAPRLLEAARATGAPDLAFNRFADFFTALSGGVQVQSLFLAEPRLFQRLVEAMALAPRLARTLARRPQALEAVIQPQFQGPPETEIETLLARVLEAAPGFEAAMDAARRIHREDAFRIGVGVMAGALDARSAGRAFTRLADACVGALAQAALRETERRAGGFPGAVAVVALGKAGSSEMTATSDLDLMTLYAGEGAEGLSSLTGLGAETFYARFTQRLVAALSAPTAEGDLYKVDLQLRPSGTAGPVAVSLRAFETYHAAEAETWEALALTRARIVWSSAPDFRRRAEQAIETALRRPRDPGRAALDVAEMRELMHKERPARGPWDLKLAPGGLVDVEFAVQLLEIVGAASGGPLRTNTADALKALSEAKRAPPEALERLSEAWTLQQDLSQVLRISLEEGGDPEAEPKGLRRLLAAAGGARTFPALKRRLSAAQASAGAAFLEVRRSLAGGAD